MKGYFILILTHITIKKLEIHGKDYKAVIFSDLQRYVVQPGGVLSFGDHDCGCVPTSAFLSLYFSQRNGLEDGVSNE